MDHYAVLGVPRDATETEIRAAYGRRALALQTDQRAGEPGERARLDVALATLTDPEQRGAYDAALPRGPSETISVSPDPTDMASAAFVYARNGALWFAGGAVLTAATFLGAGPGGRFTIAWGAILFGAIQLLRGLAVYLGAPASGRTRGQMISLAALVTVGLVAGGSVLIPQAQGAQTSSDLKQWNAAIDASQPSVDKAIALYKQIQARSGSWSSQDSADATRAGELYGQAADALAKAPPLGDLAWYRDGMVTNYRVASDILTGYGRLTSTSSQATMAELDSRWSARLADLVALNKRLDAQNAK